MYFISLESAEGDKFKYRPFKTVQVKVRMFIVGDMDVAVPSLPTNSGIGHVTTFSTCERKLLSKIHNVTYNCKQKCML